MGMKRSRIKYIMFCITIIFIMSTVRVFAQQQEDIRQQQVLKTWAEAYGEDDGADEYFEEYRSPDPDLFTNHSAVPLYT